MKRLVASLTAMVALLLGTPASATISYDLNLPGIGGQIPVLSFSLGAQTLNVAREIDGFSPALLNAIVSGTVFSAGSLDTYDSSLSTTIPVTTFVMTNVVITNLSFSGGVENVGLSFLTGQLVSNSIPEPSSLLLLLGAAAGIALVRSSWRWRRLRQFRPRRAETSKQVGPRL